MLESIPVPWQALLWPLLGAAIVLVLGRLLPRTLGRLVALAASLASLLGLWSLRGGTRARLSFDWDPFNFFRMGPTLAPDGLSMLVCITLTLYTAATVAGMRGTQPRRATWHALALVALSGALLLCMAGNLLTLALGSGLLDLALAAMAAAAVAGPGAGQRALVRMGVPGMLSTLLLALATVQMDAATGTASLLAREIPAQALVLIGVAGLLRLASPILHPGGLEAAELGATSLLPVGVGIYLVARVQGLEPVLGQQPWALLAGAVALLGGGWAAWAGFQRPVRSALAEGWTGLAVHQAGFALCSATLLAGLAPWPLMSLTLALGSLAIWWDCRSEGASAGWLARLEAFGGWLEPRSPRAAAWLGRSLERLGRWGSSPLVRYGSALLPGIALFSLLGLPLTLGAAARWQLYAGALRQGKALLLLGLLCADSMLAAGVWAGLRMVLRQARERRPPLASALAMAVLATALIVVGLVPRSVTASLGGSPPGPIGVSPWGLGLLAVLPWLLGAWLTRTSRLMRRVTGRLRRILSLEALLRTLDRVGQALVGAVYWLGSVGEGEGWWGWALVILALGALFLAAQ